MADEISAENSRSKLSAAIEIAKLTKLDPCEEHDLQSWLKKLNPTVGKAHSVLLRQYNLDADTIYVWICVSEKGHPHHFYYKDPSWIKDTPVDTIALDILKWARERFKS